MTTPTNIPKIYERKDIIRLSAELICRCDRTKEKAHCPCCGKVKLYGMSETTPAAMPDGNIISNCKVYRCIGCGEKFNDVDWYFNCHAPIKIDWAATKAKQKQEILKGWQKRIQAGERFDWNDRQKCKSECGFDPEQVRIAMKDMERIRKSKPQTSRIDEIKDEIQSVTLYMKDHPEDTEAIKDIEQLNEELHKLENGGDTQNDAR